MLSIITMDALQYLVLLASFLLIIYQLILRKSNIQPDKLLPISPPGLPIIGHLHLLKKLPLHQTLKSLSNKYGSIFLLRLGSRPAIVLSSRSAIEECFTKNDIIFSNRPLLPSRKSSTYNFTSIGAPYGDHWRNLRRFTALEIFSPKRLQMSSDIRAEEVRFMMKHLFQSSSKGLVQKVDVKLFLYMLDFNIIMRMVAGTRCFKEEELMEIDKAKAKLDEFKQMFTPFSASAVGDYLPFLRWLTSWLGAEKKLAKTHKKRDAFSQALLEAHRNGNSVTDHGEISQTLVEVMLKLQEDEPEFYTDNMIKGIMQLMLIAGTHTTVNTMASVISRLISHPEVLKNARNEIDNLVGQSRLLNDADLAKIPYLHCIINETLRLDTLIGVLPARESTADCTVAGYNIPAGTQLLVNVWAVHTDPKVWTEPKRFMPERFQDCEEEKGGFKFLAFGAGRRQCPGVGLAMTVMTLSLGTLIQCFEWEKVEDESDHSHGKVKSKLEERCLKVKFRPREELTKVIAQL